MMKEEENLAANEAKNQMVHTILFSRATGTGITPKIVGSRPRWLAKKNQQRIMGHVLLFNDYFSSNLANGQIRFL